MSDNAPPKLTGQRLRIYDALTAGEWLTLPELEARTGDSQSSISAQMRHLKRPENGGYPIKKRRRGNDASGYFEYWLRKSDGANLHLVTALGNSTIVES